MEDRATGQQLDMRGYFRKLGVSLELDESLQDVVNSIITDGVILWDETTVEDVEWDTLDLEMQKNSREFGCHRFWYEGPYFLFPES